jgi:hypothetical protein
MIRCLAVVAAALALAAPAVAGDIGVTFGIATGSLAVKAPARTLGSTTRVPITVVDARGSGAGWTLRLSGAGAAVTRLVVRCAVGATCTLPQDSVSLPAKLGSGATPVLTAAPHSGMGAMVVVATVSGGHGALRASVASS